MIPEQLNDLAMIIINYVIEIDYAYKIIARVV